MSPWCIQNFPGLAYLCGRTIYVYRCYLQYNYVHVVDILNSSLGHSFSPIILIANANNKTRAVCIFCAYFAYIRKRMSSCKFIDFSKAVICKRFDFLNCSQLTGRISDSCLLEGDDLVPCRPERNFEKTFGKFTTLYTLNISSESLLNIRLYRAFVEAPFELQLYIYNLLSP